MVQGKDMQTEERLLIELVIAAMQEVRAGGFYWLGCTAVLASEASTATPSEASSEASAP